MSKLLAYVVFAYWFLLSSFGVPLSAQPLILCGDANRDGEVTLSDVVLALRLAVMLQNPTPWQWDALDFNRDGRIDVGEVRSVLKKVVDPSYNLEGGFRCLGERSEAGIYPIPAPTGSPVPPPPPPSTKQPIPPPAESPPSSSISSSVKQTARVIRVIDGDTIEVDIQGRLYRVRYIGIDAPESNQPFGPEATAKNRELVGGKTVLLEKDVSETDRYGRLLRYVWVGNLLVNVELVRLGYAQVVTIPPDVKYHQILLLAQREAQAYQRGLWAPQKPPAESPPSSSISSSVKQTARVIRVIDGDTIEVDIQGRLYRVRYIGIDAPESNQPFGPEATAKNRELVGGKTVLLEKDVSETDRYGRLLRYVWVGNLLVNVELVRLGYAQVVTVPPDVKYHQILLLAQREAQAYQRGLWAPQKPPTGVKYPCDPSYPSVCIPPPELVGDLDCKDIPFRRFPVLPPDPHRFDGDRDGIGCEK